MRFALLALLTVGGTLAPQLDAQERKLNAPLPANADVVRFSISADGDHALYVASEGAFGSKNHLYSARLDARSTPVRLNGPLPSGGQVRFELSSRERVVFAAPMEGVAGVQLLSVPIEGGTPIVLNPPLVTGGNVATSKGSAAITSDGTRVVYRADQEVTGRHELYVVPIDGGAALKLNHGLTGTWSVTGFTVDSAGGTVAYLTAENTNASGRELHSVAIDGSWGPLLLDSEPYCWRARNAAFSPDGQWITYQIHIDQLNTHPGLWLVPVDASRASILLSDNPFFGYLPSATEGTFTGAGDRVVVLESSFHYVGGLHAVRLFSSTLDGAAVEIDHYQDVQSYLLGGDGFTVFYDCEDGVFRVPADDSAAPLQLAPSWSILGAVSGDGAHLVYVTRQPDGNHDHVGLYALPLAGGTPVELDLAPPGQSFAAVRVSPDSRHILYLLGTLATSELYSVAIDGSSAPARLHGTPPILGGVESYELSGRRVQQEGLVLHESGGRAVFSGDLDVANKREVYLSFPGPSLPAPVMPAPPRQMAGG